MSGTVQPPPSILLAQASTWSAKQTFSAGVSLASGQTLDWNSDLYLARDAANVLAQRNSTNAQAFRVYNTYTDASNYELGQLLWTANTFFVGTVAAGTGTARDVSLSAAGTANVFLRTNGVNRWQTSSAGNLIAVADNTYDIGASGATRPRSIYAGSNIVASGFVSSSSSVRATAEIWTGDNIGAPAATAGYAKLYVDAADGDLKVIFGDGVIKTLATDT